MCALPFLPIVATAFLDDKLHALDNIHGVSCEFSFAYSADEGVVVGADHETPVSEDYKEGDNKFEGKIHKVTIETFPEKK